MEDTRNTPENPQPNRVRAARGYRGWTQQELADELHVSAQFVKRVERGDRILTSDELVNVAEVCGVPTWFMFNGWEGPTRDLDELWKRMEALESSFENRVTALIAVALREISSAA